MKLTCLQKSKDPGPQVELGLVEYDWGVVMYIVKPGIDPANCQRVMELFNDGTIYLCMGTAAVGLNKVRHGYTGPIHTIDKEKL